MKRGEESYPKFSGEATSGVWAIFIVVIVDGVEEGRESFVEE
jgi:hypothetical protein